MSQPNTPSDGAAPQADSEPAKRRSGLSLNEDWAAFAVGLVLLVAALVGVIPGDLIP